MCRSLQVLCVAGGRPSLQALKRAWDPDNVFNRNQNVKPS